MPRPLLYHLPIPCMLMLPSHTILILIADLMPPIKPPAFATLSPHHPTAACSLSLSIFRSQPLGRLTLMPRCNSAVRCHCNRTTAHSSSTGQHFSTTCRFSSLAAHASLGCAVPPPPLLATPACFALLRLCSPLLRLVPRGRPRPALNTAGPAGEAVKVAETCAGDGRNPANTCSAAIW